MAMASHSPRQNAFRAQRGNRFYALILGSLCVLFALRVVGQAVQRWLPLSFLPPSDAFQGSGLPYGLLLAIQLVILALMFGITSRVYGGALRKSARAARRLGWIGCIYMGASLARLAIGIVWDQAPAWFTAWIPGAFHVVLAAFVLTLAAYHALERTAAQRENSR
jgi:hypothetical protein